MDLCEELSLALILEMVDRQPRDDRIKGTRISQRKRQVMNAEFHHRVTVEPFGSSGEHRLRGVNPHCPGLGMPTTNHGEQTAVAGAEVEEAIYT